MKDICEQYPVHMQTQVCSHSQRHTRLQRLQKNKRSHANPQMRRETGEMRKRGLGGGLECLGGGGEGGGVMMGEEGCGGDGRVFTTV